MTILSFPYTISPTGRTATSSDDQELPTMVLQVLRTALGSRMNRPDFGSRVDQMVFAAVSEQFAGSVEVLVRSALTHWLSDKLEIRSVDVVTDDSTLLINLTYAALPNRQVVAQSLSQPIGLE